MSQFRNISADDRQVRWGVSRAQTVPRDGVITVDEDVTLDYAHQPEVWEPVDDSARAAVTELLGAAAALAGAEAPKPEAATVPAQPPEPTAPAQPPEPAPPAVQPQAAPPADGQAPAVS